jgi:prevent-host-death family protein
MADDFSNLLSIEFVSLSEAKAKLSEQVRRVLAESKRVAITTNGKPTAVLLSYKDYLNLLQQLSKSPSAANEDIIDLKQWKRGKNKRRKVVQSITKLFNPLALSRKGQKAYKRDMVRDFHK